MSKFNAIQANFTSGEISPKCYGRVDISRYGNALARQRNLIGMVQGGVKRRSGSVFVSEVHNSTYASKLLEFQFSNTQNFILEFSQNIIRFYNNNALVLSSGSPYTVVSPYTAAELPQLKYCQSADIVYLFHPNHPVYVLSRFGNTNWTMAAVTFVDGPYFEKNYYDATSKHPTTTLTLSGPGPGPGLTVAASAPLFAATDVGRHIRIMPSAKWGWGIITGYTDSTHVTVEMKGNGVDATTATTKWKLGAWSSTLGYPTCGTFHQQRLVLAGSKTQPQTTWFSAVSDFYNFGTTGLYDPNDSASGADVNDDNGFTYGLASERQNGIVWLQSSNVLLLGTNSSVWRIEPNNYTTALTPTNVTMTSQSSNGSSSLCRQVRVGYEVFYAHASGREVYKLVYNFQISSFESKSVSTLAEHLLREGQYVIDVAFQQQPNSILWFLRNDGALAALTYSGDEQVLGWHLHTIAGSFGAGRAVVESIAVIPTADGTQDQLWMTVKRTIDGVTKRYVEFVAIPYEGTDTERDNTCFVDSAASWTSGTPSQAVTGFPHLKGQTVQVLADGNWLPDCVVDSSGGFTIQKGALKVVAGLRYDEDCYLKTLRIDGGGSAGTAQGKKKRIHRLSVRFWETVGCQVSEDGSNWEDFPFENTTSDPTPLVSDDVRVPFDSSNNFAGQFYLRAKGPYPFSILALMPEEIVAQ